MIIERILVDADRIMRQVLFFPVFRLLYRTIKANHLLLLALWCPIGSIMYGMTLWVCFGVLETRTYGAGWLFYIEMVIQVCLCIFGFGTTRYIFLQGIRLYERGTLKPILGHSTFRAIKMRWYIVNLFFFWLIGEIAGSATLMVIESMSWHEFLSMVIVPQNALLIWAFVLFHLIDLYDPALQGQPKTRGNP